MKNTRKGMGRGLGCGYKNIAPMDAHIHSLSAKGLKTQSVLKKYNPKGKMMLFNRIDEGTEKPHKARLYTCTNCGHQYFEDEGTCPVCHMTDILDFDAKGGKKWKVWVDGWDFEFKTVAKTEEQALKNVNEMTKGELSRLIEAGGDYNISQIGKKKKTLNAQGVGLFLITGGIADNYNKTLNAKTYHGSEWRKQYLEMETPESCDIASHLKHSKVPDSKFDTVQLKKGIGVEMEHTTSRKVAKAITKAHLTENKDYYKKFNPKKNSKEYLLNAEAFLKRYNQDQVIASARSGSRMKFQSKEHRDKVFKALKMKGLNVKKRVVKGQLLHPEYVEDYEGTVETGFGNTMYQTMFPTLYVVEVR
jgi:uncharacterized Zn finger protein (UPF0148 family)